MIRVKICCISSCDEAKMAIEYGASALGFVSKMPSGPGVIPETLIAEIASKIPPAIGTFLLTSHTNAEEIILQQKKCNVNAIQICDRIDPDSYRELRNAMPEISLVQVVHVVGHESLEEAVNVSPHVDAVLLDSGNQSSAIKELGGTGRTHDWQISNEIVSKISIPVFLAGGLNPDNVRRAISSVRPFAVDVCSGVRSNNKLDCVKLKKFMHTVNNIA